MKGQAEMYTQGSDSEQEPRREEASTPPAWSPAEHSPSSEWKEQPSALSTPHYPLMERDTGPVTDGTGQYHDVVRRAQDLTAHVQELVHSLEQSEATNTAMHNRIHALEETSRRHTALIQRLQQLPVQSLSAEQLQSLESTIAALRQDPERIFTLVALSGQVGALDDIVHNYLEICRVIQGL